MIRINKYLSICGVTSRRGAEKLMAEGRVTINNKTVDKVGTIIDESKDEVRVDGSLVTPAERPVYVVFNKPRNVMTTLHDPFKRKTVRHFLTGLHERVYPVGRLDYDTQGVLILTNDGELAYRLSHPKFRIPRVYEARVLGQFSSKAGETIENGIKLDDGAVGTAEVKILEVSQRWSRIQLLLREGRKREVKQLCKAVGYPVQRLTRIEFAGITSASLRSGGWRHLTALEVEHLRKQVELTA